MSAEIKHLYIHIPYCAKICPYCAFYVHRGGAAEQTRFAQAMVKELEIARTRFNLNLETIYFGGGTPSLLSGELFETITAALPPLNSAVEFTLEANPATVEERRIEAWKKAGVNRISLGAQSFDPFFLQLLGRQHSSDEIISTVDALRNADFRNINLDLIFALPAQSLESWRETLQAALACQPQHLSCYALTYEEDTPFFQQRQLGEWVQDENQEIAMFEETRRTLTDAGLPPYEISNFARAGFESRHNRGYWLGNDYLGIGPSAWSTVGEQRWQNQPSTPEYIARLERGELPAQEVEPLSPALKRKERIMFGLRTREGINASEIANELKTRLLAEGLAENDHGRFRLTPRGRLVADSIAELFV